MDQPAKLYTPALRKQATWFSKSRVQNTLKLAKQLEEDSGKEVRLKLHLCQGCYYFPTMAGQAFTNQPCGHCGVIQTYSSTNTDNLCEPCAVELDACKKCGGELK